MANRDEVSLDLPVVQRVDEEFQELGRVDPKTVAAQLKAIKDEFLAVLNQQEGAGTYSLKTIDVTLTVSASGSIGWVTASAEGSLALHFE